MVSRRKIQELKHAMRDDRDMAQERKNPYLQDEGEEIVYFVQIAERPDSPIKIGYTSGDRLEIRLMALQVGCPYRLRILATTTGGLKAEQRLHESFAHAHVHGEWFEPTDGLLALIDGLPNCVRTEKPKIEVDPPEAAE